MTREVKVGNETVVLDSEALYSGAADPGDQEKQVRKAIGLPVKKGLVYYKNKRDTESTVPVRTYRLIEMYDSWYTVEITLEDDKVGRIHSSYLIEMQKPSFVADMAAQEA